MAYDKDEMLNRIHHAVQKLWDKDEAGPALADSRLGGLLNALDEKNISAEKVQKELDEIPVDKARKFGEVLKYAIDQVAGTCYTGVISFTPFMNPTWARLDDMDGSKPTFGYRSPLFLFEATVYCIAPDAEDFEVGMIQDCTFLEEQGEFANGSTLGIFLPADAPLPRGDAASEHDASFMLATVSPGHVIMPAYKH